MESEDSCVIVGGRKSLTQVYIATEAETDPSYLRHRYSSGSSSVGSVGTPNCTTPSISTSTPHHKATTMPSFGTPGCISTGYGSFQPSSYTDAYVPPLSLNNDNYSGYQSQFPADKKSEESIRIDSGYGRFINGSSSFNSPSNQSSSSPNASLWDTIVSSPVQNLRQKLRGRPSYLDEGRSRGCKIQPQQVLACLIFAIILTSIGFAFLISYNHYNRDDINKDPLNGKYGAIKLDRKVEENVDSENKFQIENDEDGEDNMKVSDIEQNFLLKDDVTVEEVEKMKLELEGIVDPIERIITGDNPDLEHFLSEVEAVVLKKLVDSVGEVLASEEAVAEGGDVIDEFDGEVGNDEIRIEVVIENSEAENKINSVKSKKKKSKNANPLMKAVPVLKKTKAKSSLSKVHSKVDEIKTVRDKTKDLDYPDDPKFREGQPGGRVRRDGSEDEVVFGDKFRKYKDDREGGFRKTEGVVDDKE